MSSDGSMDGHSVGTSDSDEYSFGHDMRNPDARNYDTRSGEGGSDIDNWILSMLIESATCRIVVIVGIQVVCAIASLLVFGFGLAFTIMARGNSVQQLWVIVMIAGIVVFVLDAGISGVSWTIYLIIIKRKYAVDKSAPAPPPVPSGGNLKSTTQSAPNTVHAAQVPVQQVPPQGIVIPHIQPLSQPPGQAGQFVQFQPQGVGVGQQQVNAQQQQIALQQQQLAVLKQQQEVEIQRQQLELEKQKFAMQQQAAAQIQQK